MKWAEELIQIPWPIEPKQERRFIETEETKFDVNNLDELTVKNSLYSMPMVWHTCLHWSWVNLVWWAFFAGSSWLDSLELKKKNRRYIRTISDGIQVPNLGLKPGFFQFEWVCHHYEQYGLKKAMDYKKFFYSQYFNSRFVLFFVRFSYYFWSIFFVIGSSSIS